MTEGQPSPGRRHLGTFLGCAIFGLTASAGATPAPRLHVEHADKHVRIFAPLDGKTTSFVGLISVVATGVADGKLTLVAEPRDLKRTDQRGIPPILRDNVKVDVGDQLADRVPHTVRIAVQNVPRPGVYRGKLLLWTTGTTDDPNPRRTSVLIEVDATMPARVQIAREQTARPMVRAHSQTGWGTDRALLPAGLLGNHLSAVFENRESYAVPAMVQVPVLIGDKTGERLPLVGPAHASGDGAIGEPNPCFLQPKPARAFWTKRAPNPPPIPTPITIPGRTQTEIRWCVDLDRAVPDHYTGKLPLVIEGLDDPVSASVAVDVRNGPKTALIVIFLGIVLGRMLQRNASPDEQRRMRQLDTWAQLQESCRIIRDTRARAVMALSVQELRRRIEGIDTNGEQIDKEIEACAERIDLLIHLDAIDGILDKVPNLDPQQLATSRQEVLDARQRVLTGDKDARSIVETIEQSVITRVSAAAPGVSQSVEVSLAQQATLQLKPLTTPAPSKAMPPWPIRGLAFLAGTNPTTAAAFPGSVLRRALMGVLLLVILALIGHQSLYITSGTTFGAGGAYDYVGLFLWGLSADIAQRTLQNLPR